MTAVVLKPRLRWASAEGELVGMRGEAFADSGDEAAGAPGCDRGIEYVIDPGVGSAGQHWSLNGQALVSENEPALLDPSPGALGVAQRVPQESLRCPV